jgi:hypothetical protein
VTLAKDKYEVGFLLAQQDVGKRIMGIITDTVWYVDPFRAKFESRSIKLPDLCLSGYRDLLKQHKKPPVLKNDELKQKMDDLAQVLMLPWWLNAKFKCFKEVVTQIYNCMEKYYDFLKKMQVRSAQNHASSTPVRSFNDNWSLEQIESDPSAKVPELYQPLLSGLSRMQDCYEPVCTQDKNMSLVMQVSGADGEKTLCCPSHMPYLPLHMEITWAIQYVSGGFLKIKKSAQVRRT